jgi:SAM-dependent methyltransferase/uncharacterized protein YbaR (Trm112 family)
LAALPETSGRDREVSIEQGVLVCVACERWYPIRDGLPELMPDHLRYWDDDREWLQVCQHDWDAVELEEVWEMLLAHTYPGEQSYVDAGAHYKQAEMAVTRRILPEGFLGPAAVAPFNPSIPNFSIDLIARFVTAVSRLGCGVNSRVFDLGCGYAWTTEWLVRLGYQAIGVDICRDYILAGLPRLGENLPHLIVGDIENLPLCDESVDAILSFDAFHHIPNRPRAMQHLARIMRAGAKMVMVEPGLEHEHHPQAMAVMQQHGILERGFDRTELDGYIQGTPLGHVVHDRSDVHSYDIYTLQKAGVFETDSLAPRALVAELIIEPPSGRVAAGYSPEVIVSIMNCGDTVWLNSTLDGMGEVHLGANLFDIHHNLLQENYARVVLPRLIRPGQRVKLHCSLPSVERPGHYVVEFDMVDHGFLWFKDYAYRPVTWQLIVTGDVIESEATSSLISELPSRIKPTELLFEAGPEVIIQPSHNHKTPIMQLLKVSWQVLTTEGLAALVRKFLNYLHH